MLSLLKINAVDGERMFVFLLSLHKYCVDRLNDSSVLFIYLFRQPIQTYEMYTFPTHTWRVFTCFSRCCAGIKIGRQARECVIGFIISIPQTTAFKVTEKKTEQTRIQHRVETRTKERGFTSNKLHKRTMIYTRRLKHGMRSLIICAAVRKPKYRAQGLTCTSRQ
jgi:hypothetical protein